MSDETNTSPGQPDTTPAETAEGAEATPAPVTGPDPEPAEGGEVTSAPTADTPSETDDTSD